MMSRLRQESARSGMSIRACTRTVELPSGVSVSTDDTTTVRAVREAAQPTSSTGNSPIHNLR